MPTLFVAISTWFTAKAYRTAFLAVIILGSLIGFGYLQARVGLAGAVVVMMVWWLTLVVIWFDERKEKQSSGTGPWLRAAFLDLYLLLVLLAGWRFVSGS